jgi:PAS domain S-box-containing protein
VPESQALQDEIKRLERRIQELEAAASEGPDPSVLERQERLQSLLDNILDGIITIDAKGIIHTFNRPAEEIFGYSADEVVSRNVSVLMPEPFRAEHDSYVSRFLDTGEARIIGVGREVSGRRKDGSTFPMDLAVSEFSVDGVRMFTGIMRNITDRKRLEEQLIQSSKLASLGELVGGIAHEINNPTSIIIMRAASLIREVKEENRQAEIIEDIQVIQRQCAKVAQITSGLLAFSRQSPFEPKPASVNRTIESAIGLIENVIKSHGVSFETELDPDLPIVKLDTARIEQVMLNLFNNAMDAMPDGGVLRIASSRSTLSRKPHILIRVSDTGEGVPKENLDRLFDPFFTTKEVGKGTGLGLSISYGIVQEHSGRLEVESQLGQGATFSLYLPIGDI